MIRVHFHFRAFSQACVSIECSASELVVQTHIEGWFRGSRRTQSRAQPAAPESDGTHSAAFRAHTPHFGFGSPCKKTPQRPEVGTARGAGPGNTTQQQLPGSPPQWSQHHEATPVVSGSRYPKSRLPTPSRRPGAQPISLHHSAESWDRHQEAGLRPEGAEICENRKPHSISSAHRSTPVARKRFCHHCSPPTSQVRSRAAQNLSRRPSNRREGAPATKPLSGSHRACRAPCAR